jgi:hypothetical protein
MTSISQSLFYFYFIFRIGGISEGVSWGDVERVVLALTRDIACMRERGAREYERAIIMYLVIEFDVTLALTGEMSLLSSAQQPDRETVVGLRRNREYLRLPEACGRSGVFFESQLSGLLEWNNPGSV